MELDHVADCGMYLTEGRTHLSEFIAAWWNELPRTDSARCWGWVTFVVSGHADKIWTNEKPLPE